jgi:S1/P1 nuclease
LFDIPTTMFASYVAIIRILTDEFLERENNFKPIESREITNFERTLRILVPDRIEKNYLQVFCASVTPSWQRPCSILGADALLRSFLASLIGFAFSGLWPANSFAWGREGHDVIALIADRLIFPGTRAKVNELLAAGGGADLASIACWADDLVLAARSEGPLNEDSEAQEFNRKFPNNRAWHFVNLPLGTLSFEEARRFTPPDSIAQAISRCIQVLEAPVANPQEFTKVQALRLLVHFVGDLHQPLHCGTGYYNLDSPGRAELITFPGQAFGKPNDRGGNLLF